MTNNLLLTEFKHKLQKGANIVCLIFRNEESLRHKIAAKLGRDLWMGVPLVETLLQKKTSTFY